jgi:hypothetical protein
MIKQIEKGIFSVSEKLFIYIYILEPSDLRILESHSAMNCEKNQK